jgi:hypothetical protein
MEATIKGIDKEGDVVVENGTRSSFLGSTDIDIYLRAN